MIELLSSKKARPISGTESVRISLKPSSKFKATIVAGQKADLKIISTTHAKGSEHYSIDYLIRHDRPDTFSDSVFKVVLEGRSRFDFAGLIDIKNGAAGSNAYLKVDVLILSPDAKANIVPSLEIAENDIKASHGATIRRISDEDLFYMQSRGICNKDAKKLIIEGFLANHIMI